MVYGDSPSSPPIKQMHLTLTSHEKGMTITISLPDPDFTGPFEKSNLVGIGLNTFLLEPSFRSLKH